MIARAIGSAVLVACFPIALACIVGATVFGIVQAARGKVVYVRR